MTATKTIFAIVALAAAAISYVDSYGPCYANPTFGSHYQTCRDCTKGNYWTYWFSSPCCSKTGYCNMICRNCDSPCREPNGDWQRQNCAYGSTDRSLPDDSPSSGEQQAGGPSMAHIMQMADTDKDGKLSYKEMTLYATNGTRETVDDDKPMKDMDLNLDGFLTVEEMDPHNEG